MKNDINIRFYQFWTTIKDNIASMIGEKASASTQDIDARLYQKMNTSIRLLEDEVGTKLVEKIKCNETKVTSKLIELDSKLHIQLKSNDKRSLPDLLKWTQHSLII